jgi:hypothetical protein
MRCRNLLPLALSLALAGLLWNCGLALAQVEGTGGSILSDISVRILEMVRGVLGQFVTGNVLTQPLGTDVVNYVAVAAQNLVTWFSQMMDLFPGGGVS